MKQLSPRQRSVLRRLLQGGLSPYTSGFGWGTYKAMSRMGLVQPSMKDLLRTGNDRACVQLTAEGMRAAKGLPKIRPKGDVPRRRPSRPISLYRSDATILREIAQGLTRAGLVNYAAELERIASAASERPETESSQDSALHPKSVDK